MAGVRSPRTGGLPHSLSEKRYIASRRNEWGFHDHAGKGISPIAKTDPLLVVPERPKTRSGKIVRRFLWDIAEARYTGDATNLVYPFIKPQIPESLGRRSDHWTPTS